MLTKEINKKLLTIVANQIGEQKVLTKAIAPAQHGLSNLVGNLTPMLILELLLCLKPFQMLVVVGGWLDGW